MFDLSTPIVEGESPESLLFNSIVWLLYNDKESENMFSKQLVN